MSFETNPLGIFAGQTAGVQSGLQQQALSQQMQQFLLALQFAQQQAALTQANQYSTQFGNAPGGNWMTWGSGGPSQPTAGTETLNALAQQFGMGTGQAALTGQFTNPQTYQWAAGTYIRNADTGAIGQVGPNGVLQTLTAPPAGVNVNSLPSIPGYNFSLLQQGQGQTVPTLQATSQAAQIAGAEAAQTGLYKQPMGNAAADAFNTKASPQTQQAYLKQYQGDPASAAAHYWQDVQGAIQQAGMTPEEFVYGSTGPTPTMALQQMYGQYGTPQQGQQTLQSINQAATLSGMYNGAPTEAARQANMQNALGQGQLGQQYLATAASLQGPQNTFQLSNYLRGAQGNPNVPVYLQSLQNNMGMPAFQGAGDTTPTPQSATGLTAQMGGTQSATPGWDYNSTLNTFRSIGQRGAQALGPGSLERLSPDELGAFGSGLGAAGYSVPSFLQQYQQSRIGQQAPTARPTLA